MFKKQPKLTALQLEQDREHKLRMLQGYQCDLLVFMRDSGVSAYQANRLLLLSAQAQKIMIGLGLKYVKLDRAHPQSLLLCCDKDSVRFIKPIAEDLQ